MDDLKNYLNSLDQDKGSGAGAKAVVMAARDNSPLPEQVRGWQGDRETGGRGRREAG